MATAFNSFNPTEFVIQSQVFLNTTHRVIDRAVELSGLRLKAKKELVELISQTFNSLPGNEVEDAVQTSILSISDSDKNALYLLGLEMKYFNARYQDINNAEVRGNGDEANDIEEVRGGLDNAGTIKDSFEKLVKKLPGWIKKILKILNEILKIVKTVL